MERYDVHGGDDAQYQPGSNRTVLRNLLGITRQEDIEEVELQALVDAKTRFYTRLDMDEKFTTATPLRMHLEWLEGIYPFAGRFRNIDIAKGNMWFAAVKHLESTFAIFGVETLGRLTPCIGESVHSVAAALAEVHGEFIAVHLFREWNSRIGRWLADAMAAQAGLPFPDYGFTTDNESGHNADYLSAIKQSVAHADHSEFTRFFVEALDRGL